MKTPILKKTASHYGGDWADSDFVVLQGDKGRWSHHAAPASARRTAVVLDDHGARRAHTINH